MAMPLYGVSVDVLAKQLKSELPAPMQVWYFEDFSATARERAASPLMQRLGEMGPSREVFPEPEKIPVCPPGTVPEAVAKLATAGTTLKHEAGARSLGVYIGPPQVRDA